MPEHIDEVVQALTDKGVPFVRSFPLHSAGGLIAFFNSDIVPCIPLCQIPGGNGEGHKSFRVGNSDDLGAAAIYFGPPGMVLVISDF